MSTFRFSSPILQLAIRTAPSPSSFLVLVCLLLCQNVFSLITPWLAGQLSQFLLQGKTDVAISFKEILLLWLFVILMQSLLDYRTKILAGITSETMVVRMRQDLYNHLQLLPLTFFHERKHGSILSWLTYDSNVIASFFSSTLVGIIPLFFSACGAIICMYFISPLIACICALLIPIFIAISKILGRKIQPFARDMMHQYGLTLSIAEENLSTLPLLKTFNRETQESRRFSDSNNKLLNVTKKYIKAQALLAPATKFIASGGIILFLLFGGERLLFGTLSTSNFISLILYGLFLTNPISGMAEAVGQTQRAISAAKRLDGVFTQTPENYVSGLVLPPIKGRIDFVDVSFGYPNRPPVFTALNLTIHPGETIAITGKNGAGKSTIAHLLMRLHTPISGTIAIDGFDISKVQLPSLRSQIGLVQQNVLLRNASIRDNLLLARSEATYDDLVRVTKAAHAYQFISALPAGFDTIIGDQGIKLSGGQKQRLSLARALLKEPPILILDEATAMFDPEGEADFIRDNAVTLKNCTVIIITHRPGTLALADRIFELREGTLRQIT